MSLRAAVMVAGAALLVLFAAWETYRSRRDAALFGAPLRMGPLSPPPEPADEDVVTLEDARVTTPGNLDATQPVPSLGEGTSGPLVEWPAEGHRVIVALRLVSLMPVRFSGYALRQALHAEGFVLGKYSIFHRADEAGRAYLSAASLTQPGSFDPETMDSQRFAGLSLFAVLPGPKAPFDTFDDLLTAARGLNDRLQGALQDERGLPLTPLRVAGLRRTLQMQLPA